MGAGVYLIRNIISNRVYVGSSIDIERRWRNHKKDLRKGKHHSPHLQRAWNKHGEDAFVFEIIELCPPDDILVVEQNYIDTLRPFYNTYLIAGSRRGVRASEETRAKQSASMKGKPGTMNGKTMPLKTRKKISEKLKGRSKSQETKKRMKETMERKGLWDINRVPVVPSGTKYVNGIRVISESTREKMSAASLGRVVTQETRNKQSAIRIGHTVSQETRKKISQANKGHSVSENARAKMREARLRQYGGGGMPEEVRKKIGQSQIGHKVSQETKDKIKQVKLLRKLERENSAM